MTDKTPLLTRAEIVALARQIADLDTADPLHNDMITLMVWELERFVDKVAERAAAGEREACAQVCDEIERVKWTSAGAGRRMPGPVRCAIAIRARGEA